MKKTYIRSLALVLVLSLVFAFAGCAGNTPESPTQEATAAPTSPIPSSTEHSGGSDAPSGNNNAPTAEFNYNSLAEKADIPRFGTHDFNIPFIDMGDESYMKIAKNVSSSDYSAYLSAMVSAGFTLYTSNNIGTNFFATFATKTQIANVMYFPALKEVRLVVDDGLFFSLPGLEKDNRYTDRNLSSMTFVSVEHTGWPGGMGTVIRLADGSFLIIDGGWSPLDGNTPNSAEWLFETLKELAEDPDDIHVAAWLITHPHSDHFGAFFAMSRSKKYTDVISVDKVIYNLPSAVIAERTGLDDEVALMNSSIENWSALELIKAHPGQKIFVKNATITVYASADIVLPQDTSFSSGNDLNVVTMIDFMDNRALFLGDSSFTENPIIEKLYTNSLKADLLQLTHHGYSDTNAGGVYRYADPHVVFWPVGTPHYRDIVSKVDFNQRFFADGIINHVVGANNITISNFVSWEAERIWNPLTP